MIELTGHFDGKVIVPDVPPALAPGQRLVVHIEALEEPSGDYMTGEELAKSEFVGMWADRPEMNDSTEYVRQLRRKIQRREL